MTTLSVSGNEATIVFATAEGLNKQYTITSNSSRKQIISAKVDDGSATEHQITGGGTKNQAVVLPKSAKKVVLTLSYESDCKKNPSELKTGGPYFFGLVQIAAVTAENGDDTDYNDAVVQFLVN